MLFKLKIPFAFPKGVIEPTPRKIVHILRFKVPKMVDQFPVVYILVAIDDTTKFLKS